MSELKKRILQKLDGAVLEPTEHSKSIDKMIELTLEKVRLYRELKIAIYAHKSNKKYVSSITLKNEDLLIEHDKKTLELESSYFFNFPIKTWRTKINNEN